MPKTLMQELTSNSVDTKLGAKKKELSLFSSNIVSFPPASESALPKKLVLHLSEYLNELSHIIMSNGDTINKYKGEEIMAFWGLLLMIPIMPIMYAGQP